MIVSIPGMQNYEVTDLVMDFNGTLAVEGSLIEGVRERLIEIGKLLRLHVVTADTFGMAKIELRDLPVKIHILKPGEQARQKAEYVSTIGAFSHDLYRKRTQRYGYAYRIADWGSLSSSRRARHGKLSRHPTWYSPTSTTPWILY